MTIRLDHTIVPAKDKVASARFFAEVFGLTVKPGPSYFAQVQVNETLTFDFSDSRRIGVDRVSIRTPAGVFTTPSTSMMRSSKRYSNGSRPRQSRMAASRMITRTARSTLAEVDGASTSRIRTGTCWRS